MGIHSCCNGVTQRTVAGGYHESPTKTKSILDRLVRQKDVLDNQFNLIQKSTLEHRQKEAVRVANVEEHLVVLEEDTKKHLAEVRDELSRFNQVYEQKIQDLEKKWEEALSVQAREEALVIDTLEGSCTNIREAMKRLMKYEEDTLRTQKEQLLQKLAELKVMVDEERQEQMNRSKMAQKRLEKYLQQMQEKIDASAEELEHQVQDVRTVFDGKFLSLTHRTDELHHNVLNRLGEIKAFMASSKKDRIDVHGEIVNSVDVYGKMMQDTFQLIEERQQ